MHQWKRVALMACLAGAPACTRWKHVPLPTPPAPPNVVSDLSRVRLNTGQSVEFLTLVVATDSLFGVRNNEARTRLTVSFDQVSRVEVREGKLMLSRRGDFILVGGKFPRLTSGKLDLNLPEVWQWLKQL